MHFSVAVSQPASSEPSSQSTESLHRKLCGTSAPSAQLKCSQPVPSSAALLQSGKPSQNMPFTTVSPFPHANISQLASSEPSPQSISRRRRRRERDCHLFAQSAGAVEAKLPHALGNASGHELPVGADEALVRAELGRDRCCTRPAPGTLTRRPFRRPAPLAPRTTSGASGEQATLAQASCALSRQRRGTPAMSRYRGGPWTASITSTDPAISFGDPNGIS